MAMATWTKLRTGEWGIKLQGATKAGESVTVQKKSGQTQTVTINKVIWSGNGVSICAIKGDEDRVSRAHQSGIATYKGKVCYCTECGECDIPQKGGTRCRECYEGIIVWQ